MSRPDPTQDPAFGEIRNLTWGGSFEFGHSLDAASAYCHNITTPIILSLAEGARPYYTFSQKIDYKTVRDVLAIDFCYLGDTPDWMNLVFTVNHGCELILTSDYCLKCWWDLWRDCGATAGYNGGWAAGGLLNDTCGQFYMTAGFELKGYLWEFPLSDLTLDIIQA